MRIFNTLSRSKEQFSPLVTGAVKMYSCGPTVYNYAHLGNLRAYLFMDLLHRALKYEGFDVDLVVNITDVGHLTDDADAGEDKMEKGARREGKSVWDVAEFYTKVFLADVEKLNILPPTTWCKATDFIQEQIDLVKQIEANGFTYATDDGIYFDTSKLDDYGKLVPNFSAQQLEAGSRVEMGGKKNPTDFALWKLSPKDSQRQMEWESPWGVGFPGWHVECTAMGCALLGEVFDLHTGGIDHIPIHHTNEIAQAQGAFGHDHVNYWMHSEFLTIAGGDRMAKSADNFLRLQTIIDKGFDPLDYRYFTLLSSYRKPLAFSWEALDAAATARKRLTEKVIDLKESVSMLSNSLSDQRIHFQGRFVEAISDDLNAPVALALVHEVLKSELPDDEKLSLVLDWDLVLGLALKKVVRESDAIPQQVQDLADKREEARKNKDWAAADDLRAEIESLGYDISDGAESKLRKR